MSWGVGWIFFTGLTTKSSLYLSSTLSISIFLILEHNEFIFIEELICCKIYIYIIIVDNNNCWFQYMTWAFLIMTNKRKPRIIGLFGRNTLSATAAAGNSRFSSKGQLFKIKIQSQSTRHPLWSFNETLRRSHPCTAAALPPKNWPDKRNP